MKISNNYSTYQGQKATNFTALKAMKFMDKFKDSSRAQNVLSEVCYRSDSFRSFYKHFDTNVFFTIFKGDIEGMIKPKMYVYYSEIPEAPLSSWQMFKSLFKTDSHIEIEGSETFSLEEAAGNLAKKFTESSSIFDREVEISKKIQERSKKNN